MVRAKSMFRYAISIHSLRVEGDDLQAVGDKMTSDFNPLPPCGGRHRNWAHQSVFWVFQSTPSVWRETIVESIDIKTDAISIHSLRVEGDQKENAPAVFSPISIHSLRVEGDLNCSGHVLNQSVISIHSLRVEGDKACKCSLRFSVISIHSLRVEGDDSFAIMKYHYYISIHSLRVEGDTVLAILLTPGSQFQSTPSVWRETCRVNFKFVGFDISIHSLRVEGDCPRQYSRTAHLISIHSLRVEGDLFGCDLGGARSISIHSLRVEGDP